jgi:class 3 adenylate cyclase
MRSRRVGVAELPSGTVTFLFTDLEGSTRLWEEHPDAMQGALARHDDLVCGAIEGLRCAYSFYLK